MFDSDSPPSSSQCDSWDYFTEFFDEFSLNWPSLTRLVSASLNAFDTSKMPITRIDMPSSIIVSSLLVTCVLRAYSKLSFCRFMMKGKMQLHGPKACRWRAWVENRRCSPGSVLYWETWGTTKVLWATILCPSLMPLKTNSRNLPLLQSGQWRNWLKI